MHPRSTPAPLPGPRAAALALALALAAAAPARPAAEANPAAPAAPAPAAAPSATVQPPPDAAPDAMPVVTRAETSGNYVLRPGDVVQILVFDERDLCSTTRLAADGTIDVALAGAVKVGGLTVREAAAAVRQALLGDYLINPQVTIMVAQATKQFFTMLGQVARPGSYEVPTEAGLPLLQAVGLAGGFTRSAQPGNIIVRRMVDGKETTIKVNAKRLAGKEDGGAFVILPNDVVTVAESLF